MRNFFKLGLSAGAVILFASMAPACGSDDEEGGGGTGNKTSGGGSGGTGNSTSGGGSGGTDGGGSGGTAGSQNECSPKENGGDACISDAATCACGASDCPSYKVGGLITVAPCCAGANKDKCGVDVPDTVAGLLSIGAGCYETAQEGEVDDECAPFKFTSPLPPNDPAEFPGCCHPDGTCGFAVDLTDQDGPNMGCVQATCAGGAPKTCTPGGSDAGTGGSSGAAGSAGAGPGDASAD
jgi:hypothetical protein